MSLGKQFNYEAFVIKRQEFLKEASNYETEAARIQAEKRIYELYAKTPSLAMKGLLQLGLRLCTILHPEMADRFINLTTELTIDDCLHLTDFLLIIEEMADDPFFKERENDLNIVIQKAIQNEQQFCGHLLFSNIFFTSVKKDNCVYFLQPMKTDIQQLYLREIKRHNERNVVSYYLANQSLLTEPLCEFFRKFHQQSSTIPLKRQAFLILATCIFNATDPSILPELLRRIVLPSDILANEPANQLLDDVTHLGDVNTLDSDKRQDCKIKI